ncbi:MAG: hypothetical protein E7158_01055 [Firmicutes bacterium]|nr:hypothetical protein [Bacillota bacterium]
MKNRGIGLLALFMIAVPFNAKAKVGTMNIESSNILVGETKEVNVLLSSDVASADGFVKSSDNTCLEIINVSSDFGSGNYFASIDLTGKVLTKATTITVKGLKECNAKIIIDNASIGSINGMDEDRNLSFESSNIRVEEPKTEEKINNNEVKEEAKLENKVVEKTTKKENKNVTKSNVKKETKKEHKNVKKNIQAKKTTKKLFKKLKIKLFKELFR